MDGLPGLVEVDGSDADGVALMVVFRKKRRVGGGIQEHHVAGFGQFPPEVIHVGVNFIEMLGPKFLGFVM